MSRTINLGRVTGKSAYEIWLDEGNVGTEQDFLDSLKGADGTNGQDGYTPVRGTDYWTTQDISAIEQYCANYIDTNINQAIGGSY